MTDGSQPRIVSLPSEAHQIIVAARRAGQRVGLVPTMGALHAGHLSLVRASRAECDVTAVTIFVNPMQFGPAEDFGRYPRTFPEDVRALADLSVDLVVAPATEELYPHGFSTYVEPPAVASRFEGQCRPGHFRGVATIVLKLLNLLPADMAFFGQKDYQQCLVVQRMVADLNLPVAIRMCPIVREADGLAMSSRNRYLSSAERQQATALSQGLSAARQSFAAGERATAPLIQRVRDRLASAGIQRIDYIAVADACSLEPVEQLAAPAVLLVAAYVGSTRLIDNALLS